MTKTVAILGGTGNQGPGLALRWTKSGQYKVIIGSRKAEKAITVATELNQTLGQDLITGLANDEAVESADICVLTVPYSAQRPTLTGLKELLQGKILVDVTVPLKPPKVARVNIPEGRSAGEEAQAILGDGVRVVSAFQNVSATHLMAEHDQIDCDILICGDDKTAKQEVVALVEAAGMRGVNAGPMQNAVVIEGFTSILIGINIRHKTKGAGIKITGI
ncbi:NADPH-dependent F420 reductase [Anaerolineales bacterium HSG6]|nr:NADPH-dependent F420 reductase [Anaerolineales bacterium HSG6]